MKKVLSLIWLCSLFAFGAVTPEFQAFAPNFIKLGKAVNGYHDFTLKVDVAPWSFVYKGQVKAPNGDPYLLFDGMDAGDVFIVIAYVPAPVQGSDGEEYQTGIFDVMIYYTDGSDELAATIRNASVELLPPLSGDTWAQQSMASAQDVCGGPGLVWKDSKYTKAVTVASADPLDKEKLLLAKKAKKEKQKKLLEEKNALREQAKQDSIAAAKATKKKKKAKIVDADDSAYGEDSEETAPVVKKKKKKKAVVEDDESVVDNDAELTPKERKKLAVKAKKEKQMQTMESSTEDGSIDEDTVQVVKKKTKKKKKVVVYEDDEYEE